MEKQSLSCREQAVYDYIVEFRSREHYSPSMRMIMTGMDLHTTSTIHRHIHSLVNKGWLEEQDGIVISFVPTDEEVS